MIRFNFLAFAKSRSISLYDNTSGPPMSKLSLNVAGLNRVSDKNLITSEMPMGWHLTCNHLGVIIIGSFSTKSLIISKEALPDPIMIPARNAVN